MSKQKSGGGRQEAGGRTQEAGGRTQEAGGRTQEAGGRTQEAGGRTQKAGGRRQKGAIAAPGHKRAPAKSCGFRLQAEEHRNRSGITPSNTEASTGRIDFWSDLLDE